MKFKLYPTFKAACVAVAAIMFAACDRQELEEPATTTYPELNYELSDQSIEINAETPQTKGEIIESFETGDKLGVYAYFLKDGTWSGSATPNFMNNQLFTLTEEGVWDYSPKKYWSNDPNDKVRFYGYYPYDAPITFTDIIGIPSFSYTVPTNVTEQMDIMVTDAVEGNIDTPVNLNFKHIMTAIKLVAADDVEPGTISNIRFTGVHSSGTYQYKKGWSTDGTTNSFTFNKEVAIAGGKEVEINDGKNILMMIPQTLPDDAMIYADFTPDSSPSQTLTLSASIGGSTWKQNCVASYTISVDTGINNNPLYDIAFNGTYYFSGTFAYLFELVDDNGVVVEPDEYGRIIATSQIKKYRFKKGMENWGGKEDVSDMFKKCKQLVSITLPASWGNVKNVGNMFWSCSDLKNVTLPDDWGEVEDVSDMFSMCSITNIILPKSWGKVKDVGSMFYWCSDLVNITLPDSWGEVTSTSSMFNLCNYLTNITLPSDWGKVTKALQMFRGCERLTSVTLPQSWNQVDAVESMFQECEKLTSVTLPASWGKITSTRTMFEYCTALNKGIMFKDWGEVTDAGLMFRGCDKLTNVTLPQNWGNVGDIGNMFYGCENLESVTLPSDWGKVWKVRGLFSGCPCLREVTLPQSWGNLTNLESMFEGSGITNIVLPDDWGEVTDVRNMFYQCKQLQNITLPKDWKNLYTSNTFSQCLMFNTKAAGLKISEGYYQSPRNGVFPIECYKEGIGLNTLNI